MTISRTGKLAAFGATVIAIALMSVAAIDGRTAIEKIALRLLTPVGLLWVALLCQTAGTWLRRRWSALAWSFGLLSALTLLGNGSIAGALLARIEQPYLDIDPLTGPEYDVVIVLGGGSTMGAVKRPQLNQAGDRLLLAAQMYHAGKVRSLFCTGQSIRELNPDGVDPAEQSRRIFERLAIPRDAIRLSGGRNTAEEFRRLAEVLPPDQRVCVLTSAWHMPRALRLAKANGLSPVAAPADFRGTHRDDEGRPAGPGALLLSLIPSAEAMSSNALVWKEGLARLIGR